MPELPEVETVVRDLRPAVSQQRVTGIWVGPHSLRRIWQPEWSEQVAGDTILGLTRRGKWMRMPMQRGGELLWHLGMTGQMTVHAISDPLADHLHLRMQWESGHELRFRDIRRFGSVDWFASSAQLDAFLAERLGPEPFDLTDSQLAAALQRTTRPIKAALLDQLIVAGVGNIYADEALFRAHLPPQKPANQLTADEITQLRLAIVHVIEHAIDGRGSTIRNYVGGSGLEGSYQDEHQVYGRTDQPCRNCATAIHCVRIAGRSSHYCPQCQPESLAVQAATAPAKRKRRG
ncbi:bifunctional DNA-formamidopyrimidine glycosylase/DNA-(apurinic or apyrimidinic site) lyase [Tuwongella immobilis]|uniref:Formamidopyrimidine-DNA glycosylase n=1 Tax=Tuwongella immobilis TaxID=692036 RepID=A0A6C2YQ01_9BACT|nr:bifunctional DNA-formamidopyrimidine glycosylase/DNA-(apurinic or apyrimidinic site) lyase [Tuwongella immobilis]VIP03710.1 5-hydroxymethyluracil dna glycosylase : Formamidopyrimidine-DNA glycosylase OS=Desulfotomaculum acetoxidans (strain ATCC 49208 / DSM 771 / VKM B-1644) GN=mutM PE=3 SV=1: Fapy_DNA_glyco: H2TH: zf-FPG_IleRS [Tuwongella immobilis]VTS04788.1 5-hydroxymethyluracil dna glycosylase : Formamidopyrimidine-DNA glycosylase OS=Desulfotomaculum acetoxidans (strain ATCC 49208 / DSM 771